MANGPAVRKRRDVWKLSTINSWHPTLLWYAKAIGLMQTRAYIDPTGWLYQAAIHDYAAGITPPPKPGDPLPSALEQLRFWRRCQHGSWFFLPWHRMYLAAFEKIIMAAVKTLGGPADWALPYWNYSDSSNVNARLLPPAFIAAALPGGGRNPLRIAERDYTPAGNVDIVPQDVDLSCLQEGAFAGAGQGTTGGFGGAVTGFMHGGRGRGGLELIPHGTVHGAVGGFMASFATAGLDPIFWLHHANIDRLWEVWRSRKPTHTNPTETAWLDATGATFEFHDATGAIVNWVPRQITDTTVLLLNYTYEDVSNPLPLAAPVVSTKIRTMDRALEGEPMPNVVPEMVGATGAPLRMLPGVTTAEVALRAPRGPARMAGVLESASTQRHVFLNLENITGVGAPTNYSVFLNVPAGEDPARHEGLFAGSMPTFGAAEASQAEDPHGGSGLTQVLDITALVNRLAAKGQWDESKLRVSFMPRKPLKEGAQVAVGRVSVYYR